MTADDNKPDFNIYEEKMERSFDMLKSDMEGLKVGRAHPSLLDGIKLKLYGGSTMSIRDIASVNASDSRTLLVSIWDASIAGEVQKAIRDAGLGLDPILEGGVLRISLPTISGERRREVSRVMGKYAESARVAVRNVRRECMDKIKSISKQIAKDDAKKYQDKIQKLTDKYIENIDNLLEKKQKELTEI